MNKHISLQKCFPVMGTCLLLMLLSACGHKDSCNVPCYNGVCINNSCNCNLGYEGDSCTKRTSDKFIGSYNAVDSCESNNYGYIITIAGSTVANQLVITNFGEYGTNATVNADISGFNFSVEAQNVQNNSITLSGNGTIDTLTKTITVSYLAEDAATHVTLSCSGVWTKIQ